MINLNFTLFLQIINFLILVALLYRILYRPITHILDERRKKVESLLKEAEKREEESRRSLAEAQKTLKEAKEVAKNILEKTKEAAERERRNIIEEAKREAERIMNEAQRSIALAIQEARMNLQQEAVDIGCAIAEKLLKESIGEEERIKICKRYIEEIEKM